MAVSKKIVASFLSLLLALSLAPVSAFAQDGPEDEAAKDAADPTTALAAGNTSSAAPLCQRIAALVAAGDTTASEVYAQGLTSAASVSGLLAGLSAEDARYVSTEVSFETTGAYSYSIVIYASPVWGTLEKAPYGTQATTEPLQSTLEAAWGSLQTQVALSSYNFTIETITKAYMEALISAPEFFNVCSSFSVGYNPTTNAVVAVSPKYITTDANEYATMQSSYEARVATALATVPANANDKAVVYVLHDWLCNNSTYNKAASVGGIADYPAAFTAYGCMVEGAGVCQSYSMAFCDLLERAGIESTVLLVNTNNHAWNMVKVDGGWYHVDATWDDSAAGPRRYWFMKSDMAITAADAATGNQLVHSDWQNASNYGWDSTMVASDTSYDNFDWASYDPASDVKGSSPSPSPDPDPDPSPTPSPDPDPTPDPDPSPSETAESVRLAGTNADETSASISSAAFDKSEWAILARMDDFADAMSATGLAGVLAAPIILTDRNSLSAAAAAELTRLGVKNVYIIGGKGAMPGAFESQLAALGVTGTVQRVYGSEYFDTSVECAKKISEHGGSITRAIVAYGQNFQDALSISSYAYKYHVPILLETPGATSAERSLTQDALNLLNTTYASAAIYVPGGPGAVSVASVEGVFGASLRGGKRIYGQTGYDTSNELATYFVGTGELSAATACIATGAEAAKGVDALAGAALVGKNGGVMLLASAQPQMEAENYTAIDGFLAGNAASVKSCYVLGGAYVLPSSFKARVDALLNE